MNMLNYLILRFDLAFRNKKYARVLLSGIKSEMLRSLSWLKLHIANEQSEINLEKEIWNDRKIFIKEKYQALNSYGFKNRAEYFSAEILPDEDKDLEILNIIQGINENEVTNEAVREYHSRIENHTEEIEAAKKIIAQLEKMSPILCSAEVQSISEIEKLFEDNDCSLLLRMPRIISIERVISEHYFR